MARVTVLGASGRMGKALIRLIAASGEHELVGALGEPGDLSRGRDAGQVAGVDPLGVLVTDDLSVALAGAGTGCEVAIDFTVPAATEQHAQACAAGGHALVVGTTGLGASGLSALQAAARRVPVLYARNMSLGVTVLTELVRQAAALLGPGVRCRDHRGASPSQEGLALWHGAAARRGHRRRPGSPARGRGRLLAAAPGRLRNDLPALSALPLSAAGAIVGDHTVLLAGTEELLELTHRATDRALFARGALRAASWLVGQPRRPATRCARSWVCRVVQAAH